MFLKNYTSNVPVSRTVYRIEQVLIRCGASGIMKEYAGTKGEIVAISFQIETATGKMTIRLPADKNKALEALWLDYVGDHELAADGKSLTWRSNKRKRRSDFAEQADRTAWKIIQDWVEVQMSMIQLKQADTVQVFLPYVYDGKRTFYERLVESRFKGLLPEKSSQEEEV